MYCRKLIVIYLLTSAAQYSYAVEFNNEFLNIDNNDDISLGQFTRAQYTVPGTYLLDTSVNQRYFGTRSVEFKADASGQESYACLPEAWVATFGLKPAVFKGLPRLADGQCVDLSGIEGASVKYQKTSRAWRSACLRLHSSMTIPLTSRLPPGAMASMGRCSITA